MNVVDSIFIVVSKAGIQRTRKTYPPLQRGEIAIKVEIVIDQKAFLTPTYQTRVSIDKIEDAPEIHAEIKEKLRPLGLDVEYILKPQDKEDQDNAKTQP